MKKAQISVLYLALLTLISIIIFGSIFLWGTSLKGNAAVEFNAQHADNLLTTFEQRLQKMKLVADPPGGPKTDTSIEFQIPVNIGEDKYFVRGDGGDLVLEIPGSGFAQGRQTIFRRQVYWWAANFTGLAFSGNTKINFAYNSTSGNITIS